MANINYGVHGSIFSLMPVPSKKCNRTYRTNCDKSWKLKKIMETQTRTKLHESKNVAIIAFIFHVSFSDLIVLFNDLIDVWDTLFMLKWSCETTYHKHGVSMGLFSFPTREKKKRKKIEIRSIAWIGRETIITCLSISWFIYGLVNDSTNCGNVFDTIANSNKKKHNTNISR